MIEPAPTTPRALRQFIERPLESSSESPSTAPVVALVAALVAVMGLTACKGPTTLTASGRDMRVLVEDDKNACDALGKVRKQNSSTLQSAEEARQDALNKVLNAAAAMGGTHVELIGFSNPLSTTCTDCATLEAKVFACPDGATIVERTPTEVMTDHDSRAELEGEKNLPGHEQACGAVERDSAAAEPCVYDSQCVICHDGEGCGHAINKESFASLGAACAKADERACEPRQARCCDGVCVMAPRVE